MGSTHPGEAVGNGAPEAVSAPTLLLYWLPANSRAPDGDRLMCRGKDPPHGTANRATLGRRPRS